MLQWYTVLTPAVIAEIIDHTLSKFDDDTTLGVVYLESQCMSAIELILQGIFNHLNSEVTNLTGIVQRTDSAVQEDVTEHTQYQIFIGLQEQNTLLIHSNSNAITTNVSYTQGDVIICKPGTTTVDGIYKNNHVYLSIFADIGN
jgi:hypothetical protein